MPPEPQPAVLSGGGQPTLKLKAGGGFVKIGWDELCPDVGSEAEVHRLAFDTGCSVPELLFTGEFDVDSLMQRYADEILKQNVYKPIRAFALATRWIDGVELSRSLRMLRNPADKLARLTLAWRAVLSVHAAGIVHQDAKLDNFVVENATGAIGIVDFQLAVTRGRVNAGCKGYDEPYRFKATYEDALEKMDVFTFVSSASNYMKGVDWWQTIRETAIGACPAVESTGLYVFPESPGYETIATPETLLRLFEDALSALDRQPPAIVKLSPPHPDSIQDHFRELGWYSGPVEGQEQSRDPAPLVRAGESAAPPEPAAEGRTDV